MNKNNFAEIADFLSKSESPYFRTELDDIYDQLSSIFLSDLKCNIINKDKISFPNLPGWSIFKILGGQRYERMTHELLYNFLSESSLRPWNKDIICKLFNLVNVKITYSYFPISSEKMIKLTNNSKLIIDIFINANVGTLGIEIKTNIGTKFHKKQEDKYIEWLNESKKNHFILICPREREYEERPIFKKNEAFIISWKKISDLINKSYLKLDVKKTDFDMWSEEDVEIISKLLYGVKYL